MKETVWVAFYNPMIYESSPGIISIHKTQKGAEMAMDFHKEKERRLWLEMYTTKEDQEESPFGTFEAWLVQDIEIKE